MTGTAATMSIEEKYGHRRRGQKRGLGWGVTKKNVNTIEKR